jgi:hypothetical protein
MASLRQPDEGIGSRLKDSERAIALFRRHKLAEPGTRGELLQECSGLLRADIEEARRQRRRLHFDVSQPD